MPPETELDHSLEARAAAVGLEEDWSDAETHVEETDVATDRTQSVVIAPPPAGVDAVREELIAMGEAIRDLPDESPCRPGPGPRNTRFDAELDAAEIDDRDRPGPTWTARARGISRSCVVFSSRRMCYLGRRVIIAIHLIDDTPTPLYGRITSCEYEAEGMYRTEVTLEPIPEKPHVQAWIIDRQRN
jgi:hypothetical protein